MSVQAAGQHPVDPGQETLVAPPADPAPTAATEDSTIAAAAAETEWASRGLGADVLRARLEQGAPAADVASGIGSTESLVAAPQAAREAAPGAAPSPAQLAAEFKAAQRSGDHAKMADVIARAPAEALPLLEKQLPTGYRLEDTLGEIRKKAPEAYHKAVDGLSAQVADSGPGAKAKRILSQHFNMDVAAGDEYIDRYLKPPSYWAEYKATHPFDTIPLPPPGVPGLREKAVIALSAAGNIQGDSVGALIRYGDPSSPSFQSDLRRFPPATVDAVGKPLLREADARAHLDPRDTKSAAIAENAALALFQAGTPEGQQVGIDHYVGKAADDAIKSGRTCLQLDQQIRAAKGQAAGFMAVKAANEEQEKKGKGVLTPQGKADLDADIKMYEDKIARIEGQKDKLAEQTMKRLDDPQFKAMLAKLPPEEQTVILKPMIDNVKGTKHADAFYEKHVKPAVDGQPSVLADVFGASDKTREFALGVVESFAMQLAKKGDAAFGQAMQKALGKTAAEIAELEEAVGEMNKLKPGTSEYSEALKKVQEKAGGGVTAKGVGAAFAGFSLMISIQTLSKDPSLKNKLGVAKDAASLTKEVLGLMEATPSLAKHARILGGAGKAAGAVAGVCAVVVGVMDMNEAARYQDPGSAVGSYLEAAGGVLTVGGLAFPPLAAAGAIVGVAGWGVRKLFGDSDEVRGLKGWAQSHGYGYR